MTNTYFRFFASVCLFFIVTSASANGLDSLNKPTAPENDHKTAVETQTTMQSSIEKVVTTQDSEHTNATQDATTDAASATAQLQQTEEAQTAITKPAAKQDAVDATQEVQQNTTPDNNKTDITETSTDTPAIADANTDNQAQLTERNPDTRIQDMIAQITPATLLYEVDYAGQNAGELEISLNVAGNALTVNSVSHLSALAKLFLDPYTIKTHFVIDNGDIMIISGSTRNTSNNEVQHGFNIDHSRNKVDFYSGDSFKFSGNDIFEADSFPIKLITSEIDLLEGTEILAISGKRVTAYAYSETKKEKVNINGKRYNTVRITRSKIGDPDRTVTFWLDQDNHNLPVKIVSRSRGVNTELRIKT